MTWLIFTALSVLSRAIYGVMTKVLSGKVQASPYTQATLLSLSGAIITLLLSPFLGGIRLSLEGVNLLAVALVAIGQGLGNYAYFASLRRLTNGTAQIAFSSILIFNALLAVTFLNLHLSLINIIGVLLLLAAILSVVRGKVELEHRTAIFTMVWAAFMFATFQLSSAQISKETTAASYLLLSYLGGALVVFALKARTVISDLKAAERNSTYLVPLVTAIPSLGNFLFAYYAYKHAPEPAKVAMLLTSQVVVAVILSYAFLKERGHLFRKLGAAVLVVVSAVLIKQ